MNPIEMGTSQLLVDGEAIGGSDWLLSTVSLAPGAHYIASSQPGDKFGIMVYAYDQDVSYSFPGGLDLAKQ